MCYKCSNVLDIASPISRTAVCSYCGADVRCCKNCVHFSLGSHYDCKEHVDELIVDKERANFCDWFLLNKSSAQEQAFNKKIDDAKNQFNSLFGD